MRIRLLEDDRNLSTVPIHGHDLSQVAANDATAPVAPAPSPAETYLTGLAPGSRSTMAQALDVIANVIRPGSSANTIEWAAVGYSEVTRVRSALAAKYSPNMANKCLAALRGTLKAAFRLGLINADELARANDVRRIRGERSPKGRSLDSNELRRLIDACDQTTFLGVRNAAMIAVGCGCGLRRAELVGLVINHVLEGGQALRVLGKGNKERFVYLPDCTQALLRAWLCRRGGNQGPLFCPTSKTGICPRKLTEQTVYDVLRTIARKAKIVRISPHDLRRSFVCSLLDQGVALSTVAAMAGHSDVSTTARYDVRGERVKREASKLLNLATLATS